MSIPAELKSRPLAEVETDLLAAEQAFEDAVNRMNDARSDLEAALGRINQHQDELDRAVAALRERSPAGSRWKAGLSDRDELLLRPDQASGELGGPVGAHIESLSVHFDRLRAVADHPSDEEAPNSNLSSQGGA